jgi:hypothetical protein
MRLKSAVAASAFLLGVGLPNAFAGPVSGERGPNLVVNGGFEASSTVPTGWTTTGFGGFDSIDTNPAHAHSGTNSFSSGAVGAPGFISQTIATVAGTSYNIHLWLANFSGFAGDTEIQILWGGNLVYDKTDILGFGYNEIVVDPLATGAATTLSIGLRDDSDFLNIDDVSVRAVAEPASLALLMLGLAGIGVARRKFE